MLTPHSLFHIVLIVAAIILFVIACTPHKMNWRPEWLAFACLTATLL